MLPYIVLVICCVESILGKVPIIMTPLGLVSGVYETSYDGRMYSAFYGIPYAQPPIGELRFQEPQKITRWTGVWKANNTELTCVQVNHVPDPPGGSYKGNEDCLYLNVFFPGKLESNDELLDVIVFIHGGGFMYGSMNNHGAKFLMDRDVLLVTINYRLGVFGFISTEDEIIPGNNGLKDQVAALEWIQSYIEYFGGNPDSVTITGLSAGGASVHFHYLSPLSKGLFHRGISMSGTALGPSKMQENALGKAKTIAAHLGCTQKSTKRMVQCMKQRPTRAIAESIKVLRPWLYYPYSPLAAVIEENGSNKFLTAQPWTLLANEKFHDLPWINSVTATEGLYPGAEFLTRDEYIEELERRWKELIPQLLDYNYTVSPEKQDAVSETIKKTYLGDQPLSRENFMDFIDMISDRMFCISAEDATKMQAASLKSRLFYYFFDYIGEEKESDTELFTGIKEKYGTAHGDDTLFVLSNPNKVVETLSKNDKQIKDILLDIWTSFAKFDIPFIKNVDWTPVSKSLKEPLMQLHITSPTNILMENANLIDRKRSMWQSIPFEENENLSSCSSPNGAIIALEESHVQFDALDILSIEKRVFTNEDACRSDSQKLSKSYESKNYIKQQPKDNEEPKNHSSEPIKNNVDEL